MGQTSAYDRAQCSLVLDQCIYSSTAVLIKKRPERLLDIIKPGLAVIYVEKY